MRSRNTANRKALTTAETEQGKRMEVALMSNELSIYEAMGGTYTEVDGLFYPDITVSEESDISRGMVGKYGLLWIDYMKSNHVERYRHHIRNALFVVGVVFCGYRFGNGAHGGRRSMRHPRHSFAHHAGQADEHPSGGMRQQRHEKIDRDVHDMGSDRRMGADTFGRRREHIHIFPVLRGCNV